MLCPVFCLAIFHCPQHKNTECCFENATMHSLGIADQYSAANNIKVLSVFMETQQWVPQYFCQAIKYSILSTTHVKCRIFCPVLVFGCTIRLCLQYQIQRNSVQCKPSIHLGRGSGRRDTTKLTGAFHKYGNAPTNCCVHKHSNHLHQVPVPAQEVCLPSTCSKTGPSKSS